MKFHNFEFGANILNKFQIEGSAFQLRAALLGIRIPGVRSQEVHEKEGLSSPSSADPELSLPDLAVPRVLASKQDFPQRLEAIKPTYQR